MSVVTHKDAPRVVFFPGAVTAQLNLVGGKGQSLIRMAQIGLPVPPGFVLTVGFFEDWISALKITEEWKAFKKSDELDLEKSSNQLTKKARLFQFTDEQKKHIEEALESVEGAKLFAVRSSSPEEDLEGFSFAGGYETFLGVTTDQILDKVRLAFTSCLDYRVQCYKLAHGFNVLDPRIAVVVQEQIASDISGVVFSINPLTNNYDEVVFNANWGLGESVVSGACTPDTVIVDKWKMQVKNRALGPKESQILLLPDGGTKLVEEVKDKELCLSDGVALSLTRYVKTLEDVFRKPVDIEWAVSKGREYILQARPITSYVPLPEELLTPPGQPKKFFLDVSLVVQALESPISAMGCSVMERVAKRSGKRFYGVDFFADKRKGFARIAGGRFYIELSKAFAFMSQESVARKVANVDLVVAETIRSLDTSEYRTEISPKVLIMPFKVVPNIFKTLPGIVDARTFPYRAHRRAQENLIKFRADMDEAAGAKLSFAKLVDKLFDITVGYIQKYSLPCFLGSRYALERMKKAARIIDSEVLKKLEQALPHNITTEMGLDLFRLSRVAAETDCEIDPHKKPEEQDLPQKFLIEWRHFIEKYGHRGPGELDIAKPRYRDNPSGLLSQIKSLSELKNGASNPLKRFEEGAREREETYQLVCQRLKEIDRAKLNRFRNTYNAWEILGGYRELHKYCVIYMLDKLRDRLIEDARVLVKKGQLDSVEQIFDLTVDDLDKHGAWSKEDLRDRVAKNTEFTDRLSHIRFPALIDSRGEIKRPRASSVEDGTVAGMPISSGVIRGRAKVLHHPNEKPLEVGEILIARATDPGWTPLFVNASGLILEVGGLLQHGALVAREYGLPCVGGIIGATTIFEDGMLLEVDGSNGIVRIID